MLNGFFAAAYAAAVHWVVLFGLLSALAKE